MQGSATPSTSNLSTPIRLLIAFFLGILAGLIFLFNPQNNPYPGWMFAIPAAILFLAMLLSILFDPAVRQGSISPLRPIIGLLLLWLIGGGIVVALELIPATQQASGLIVLGVLPFALGLAIGFSITSTGNVGLAVVGALVAWLGCGIPIVINALLFYISYEKSTPGGDGGIALPLTIAYVVFALLVAALGGLVGGLLRNWFLGAASSSHAKS